MDLLHARRFDGFCLISSGSDFTRLASRLREKGLTVYGFGEEKTPKPFVAACDKFIYIQLFRVEVVALTNGEPGTASAALADETEPAVAKPAKKPKAPI